MPDTDWPRLGTLTLVPWDDTHTDPAAYVAAILRSSVNTTGAWAHVPNKVYHRELRRYPGSTQLKRMLRSPGHYLCPDERSSDAMELGSAIHAVVLEPERFDTDYFVAPKVDRRTKAGKATWQEFVEGTPAHAHVITDAQAEVLQGVLEAREQCSTAQAALSGGYAEVSVLAAVNDVACKVRPDYMRTINDGEQLLVVDMKSTTDASYEAFARSCGRYNYALQFALYADLLTAATGMEVRFACIAVESTPPYCFACYVPDTDMLEAGRRRYRHALKRLRECRATGDFPGYDDQFLPLSLPTWAL